VRKRSPAANVSQRMVTNVGEQGAWLRQFLGFRISLMRRLPPFEEKHATKSARPEPRAPLVNAIQRVVVVSAPTTKEMSEWLEKLGMSEYAQRFGENRIEVSATGPHGD
jgi:hypothetical protein